MVVNVIDTVHQKKMTYGIITYRLDLMKNKVIKAPARVVGADFK